MRPSTPRRTRRRGPAHSPISRNCGLHRHGRRHLRALPRLGNSVFKHFPASVAKTPSLAPWDLRLAHDRTCPRVTPYSLVPQWDETCQDCRMVQLMTSFWTEPASVRGVTSAREMPMTTISDKHYRARITKRVDLAPELWMIRIDPGAEFKFTPGQYATLGIEGEQKRSERPYSTAS